MSHEAFLADIAANPFSADARLVYADWLEQQGDEAGAAVLRSGMIPLCDIGKAAVDGMAKLMIRGSLIKGVRDRAKCTACVGTGRVKVALDLKATITCPKCDGAGPIVAMTPRQYCSLFIWAHRYRSQMKNRQVMDEAARRYESYCEMLDIHTKPKAQRHTTRKMDMGVTLFD